MQYKKQFAVKIKLLQKDHKLQSKVVTKIVDGHEDVQTRKLAERDRKRQEFEDSEKQARYIITEHQKYKLQYQEIISDLDFIETQINQAQVNKFKLESRIEELTQELENAEPE